MIYHMRLDGCTSNRKWFEYFDRTDHYNAFWDVTLKSKPSDECTYLSAVIQPEYSNRLRC